MRKLYHPIALFCFSFYLESVNSFGPRMFYMAELLQSLVLHSERGAVCAADGQ